MWKKLVCQQLTSPSVFFQSKKRKTPRCALSLNNAGVQGCQIFLGTHKPNWEKYTKRLQTIPNGHKLYQIDVKVSIWS
jgi:hypothetical protein